MIQKGFHASAAILISLLNNAFELPRFAETNKVIETATKAVERRCLIPLEFLKEINVIWDKSCREDDIVEGAYT